MVYKTHIRMRCWTTLKKPVAAEIIMFPNCIEIKEIQRDSLRVNRDGRANIKKMYKFFFLKYTSLKYVHKEAV